MKYYTIQPPESLKRFVRYFWVLEGDLTSGNYVHRSLADGCAEMIFHYKTIFDEITVSETPEKSFTAGISGQSRKFRRFIADKSFGIFGAYLYPFAVPQIFSFSAIDLSDQMIDLNTFAGKEGRELEERMMTAIDNFHRAEILSAFLENRLNKNKALDSPMVNVINYLVHTNKFVGVQEMANYLGLSMRQFERKFKEYAGFSPKLFQRILRFQSAASKYGISYPSLTEIGYDCGYYDQSHFIHDFKEFSGYHPKAFFDGKAEGVEWR